MTETYLEPEEVEKMEGVAIYVRDKLLIRLLWRLGCRISEVLGVGVRDIDFNQNTVTIEHLKIRVRLSCPQCGTRLSKTSRFCPGCGIRVEKVVTEEKEHHRKRTLPLDKETMNMLRQYVDAGGPVGNGEKKPLFGLKRRQASNIIRECAAKAGLRPLVNPDTGELRGISPHRLRDAFAVNAVKADDSGDGLRLLQEHLGHKSIVTTMKYRKIAGEEHREWYDKIWNQRN
ncbi:MAG: tyrosine-type recombinase/integrase [Dehalococcoidales bacterium]|nr:tyrosine-type recombinase/integrase [Dehalococcoidales bacterium]